MSIDQSTDPRFPAWFTGLTILLVVSNFVVFGWVSLLDPTIPFKEIGAGDGAFPAQFFAIRHIVFAGPLAYGLWKKNVAILSAMYAMFFVMAVLDITVLVANDYFVPILGELPLVWTITISVPGFIGTTSLALWHLSSYSTSEKPWSREETHDAIRADH